MFAKTAVDCLRSTFIGLGQIRTATKKAGGTATSSGGSPGKRLGVKLFTDQFAIPGNILVRQRGTRYLPGQHVKVGRDHTLYAIAPGFVRFYKKRHGVRLRTYVGIVLNRSERLPRDEKALGRSRYFGLVNVAGEQTPALSTTP